MNVFVMMPYSEDFADVRTTIKNAVHNAGANCVLADEITEAGAITEHMLAAIRSASVCICDITGNNANVAWETGYAHALDKAVFVVSQSTENLFFDIQNHRTIVYDCTALEKTLRLPLEKALNNTACLKVRVPPESLVGTQDHEKTSLILAATGVGETRYGFFDLLHRADRQVFVAAQNHFFFVENEERKERFKSEVRSFLLKDKTRRIDMLLCGIDAKHAIQTWRYVTTERYEKDLELATEFFQSVDRLFAEDIELRGRFEVRAVPFVPMSMSFVDPEESDGFVVFTPNVFEAKNRARACFIVSKAKNPEILKQYWAAYQLRFYDGAPLYKSKS